MNATRWRLYHRWQETGFRRRLGCLHEHYYEALCVHASTSETFTTLPAYVQIWSVKGQGNRQRCLTDQYGFPPRHLSGNKQRFGFQTGDRVCAIKFSGTWVRREWHASGSLPSSLPRCTTRRREADHSKICESRKGVRGFLLGLNTEVPATNLSGHL